MMKLPVLPKWLCVVLGGVIGSGATLMMGPDSAVEQAAEAYIQQETGIQLDFSEIFGTKKKDVSE